MDADGTRPGFAVRLFDGASDGYDRQAAILSYGQYGRWRKRLVEAAREAGVDADSQVLDVATGTAGIARALVAKTGCSVVGVDQSPGMLGTARKNLERSPADAGGRVVLTLGTAGRLPFADDSVDAVTFSYLFRYVQDPAATLADLVRVVKPGGFVGFIEFHVPPGPLWKALWKAHTRVVLPTAGRLHSRGWHEVGRFLGPNIERFYSEWSVERLTEAFGSAGLVDVDHRLMSLGGGLVMWGRKAEEAVSVESTARAEARQAEDKPVVLARGASA
ncbi:MAG: class I SAM-dependent methyltransferase [Euryarchaeota archaeon]|nr:class I SAM-dependent methyltransferase [Euryarchaeota archaeon]